MNTLDIEQGSDAWIKARVGSLGASRVSDALTRTKGGAWGATRANLMAELIAERLTGEPAERYVSPAMAWGTEHEPEARTAYEFFTNCEVVLVGLVPHPTIAGTHASPDGFVGDRGLVEIKSPFTATHIEYLLSGKVPATYATQMCWQLACCKDRDFCDFVSFDPRMPEEMRLFVKRMPRDNAKIAELERDVREFIAELDAKVEALMKLYAGAPSVALSQLRASVEAA